MTASSALQTWNAQAYSPLDFCPEARILRPRASIQVRRTSDPPEHARTIFRRLGSSPGL